MVHYGHPLTAAQLPPPICSKCGSHRTAVVGRSNESPTLVIRCNSCGERSTVPVVEAEPSGERAGQL
jgi:hypothetical protein